MQESLSQKIPGFKFNLGFSGRSFKQGDEEEDEGDNALLEHAHKFTWFGHLYDREQPHKHMYSEIVRSLRKNEEFNLLRYLCIRLMIRTNVTALDNNGPIDPTALYPPQVSVQGTLTLFRPGLKGFCPRRL